MEPSANRPLPDHSGTTLFNNVSDLLDTTPYQKSLKTARIWLYVIAGFQTAMGFFEYFTTPDPKVAAIALAIDALIGALFLILALWSRRKPVVAFTAALVFYLLVIAGFMFLDPANLFKGLLVIILVVLALVKANKDAGKFEAVQESISVSN
jgi:peptidoglycan/LPS O-acetylase OafA/YrhL